MAEEMIPIDIKSPMTFNCCSDNVCFNECCRDQNQILTPYDILRLKRNLGISSQVFLEKYTCLNFGPESGLPILALKPGPGIADQCPFVTDKGCSVYVDRPAACRMYPLARAIARSRDTKEIQEYFAIIEESHCKGFGRQTDLTVGKWLDSQDVDVHNKNNDKLVELISLKNKILPGRLEGVQSDLFYLALYNLDEFRTRIFDQNLLAEFNLADSFLDEIKNHDQALLDLGICWVKNMLFGIDLMAKA